MTRTASLLIIVVMVLAVGLVHAAGYVMEKKAQDYTVVFKMDNNPPIVGNNNASVEIKDAKGAAVTDGQVKIDYSMPAMAGMPAMNYSADAKLDGKVYKAVLATSMAGSWNIAVKVNHKGKALSVKFNVDAK